MHQAYLEENPPYIGRGYRSSWAIVIATIWIPDNVVLADWPRNTPAFIYFGSNSTQTKYTGLSGWRAAAKLNFVKPGGVTFKSLCCVFDTYEGCTALVWLKTGKHFYSSYMNPQHVATTEAHRPQSVWNWKLGGDRERAREAGAPRIPQPTQDQIPEPIRIRIQEKITYNIRLRERV